MLTAAAQADAQIVRSPPPAGASTHTVVLGGRYARSGFDGWLLGGGYRAAWVSPIEVPVLDLDTLGGLVPTGTGGDGQTVSLKFIGGDGLEYALRSIDKIPTRKLDTVFEGTVVAALVQDQVAQFLPTAALVVDPLLDATGILHPRHSLAVIPDDPRLGEYREEFAGLIGMFTDQPQERANRSPGFADSRRISGSDTFLEEMEEGACNSADARGYLKARLMDILIGDRDRHERQFRWARYPDGDGCFVWRVIPEDRDQAFVMNDGFMMSVYRLVQFRNIGFGPSYPNLAGLTFSGWELDRQLLPGLDRATWSGVVAEIQAQITDRVIEDAVRNLPSAHFDLYGDFLASSLKSRREDLPKAAMFFYGLMARQPEFRATDRDELAEFEHLSDGSLRVSVAYREGPGAGAPYFERTFRPDETTEFRLFLQGGDDVIEVAGGKARIKVRAIGGGGDDRFINRSLAGTQHTRFYDDRGDNLFEGTSRVDTDSFERPQSENGVHRYTLDWGGTNRFLPAFSYDSDIGLYFGLTADFRRNGFRKVPFRSDNAFTFGVGTTGPEFYVGWDGRYRDALWDGDFVFHADYSGLDVLRFTGFGNATAFDSDSEFFQVEQTQFELMPGLEWTSPEPERPAVRVGFGPVLKYSSAPADDNGVRLLGQLDPAPLGLGSFGQAGARAWLEIDKRNAAGFATSGFRIRAGASAYPAVWDVPTAFGEVHGEFSVFLTPGSSWRAPTVALRAGGKTVLGDFPFFESAFLGGSADVRGLRSQRYAGDAAAYGNGELRLPIARFSLIFPAEFGLTGAADVGRVFFDEDPDGTDTWHRAFGGGFWLSFLERSQTVSFTVMSSDEQVGFYAKAGFHF